MFEKPLCCPEDRIMTNTFLVHLLVDSSTWPPEKIQTRTQGYTNALFPSPDLHTLHIQAPFHQGFCLEVASVLTSIRAAHGSEKKKGKQMQLMSWKNNTLVQISIRIGCFLFSGKGKKNYMPFTHSYHRLHWTGSSNLGLSSHPSPTHAVHELLVSNSVMTE